ncbi:MAG: molybdopterin synthase catalytic subunit MoaE [Halioglobus sp.]|nr:molybdopterin synthase catalytic subunit MoaE [Halioglobus sp.]
MKEPVLSVSVQEEDFDPGALQEDLLSGAANEGAVATFTGYVRRSNEGAEVASMRLEHYPGMTQKSISGIMADAAARWPLLAASVVHRVGLLQPGERIVWVGVSSAHREAAFSACEFIMDYLKTGAPFWKKEVDAGGERWVSARASDNERARRW